MSIIGELGVCYSKSVSGELKLTPNFKVKEFACQDGTDPVVVHALIPIICQAVRNWFGYSFTPNSAYRTTAHNKSVGGAERSKHMYGKAVDIPATDKVTPKELYNFLDKLCGNSCEIGLYSWGVHVAVSETKSRFNG